MIYKIVIRNLTMIGITYLCLFLINCSKGVEDLAGGKTTETTNGTSGLLLTPDGKRAEKIEVTLIPTDFIPSNHPDSLLMSMTTDEDGLFSFTGLGTGSYVVTALSEDSSLGVFLSGITFGDSIQEPSDSIVQLSDIALSKTGSLSGTVILNSIGNEEVVSIEIYGLNRTIDVSKDGNFHINALPSSLYTIRVFTKDREFDMDSVEIKSGDTTHLLGLNFLNARNFKGRKIIDFNTTSTGAGVSTDIIDYPLLVRLDGSSEDSSIFKGTQSAATEFCFVDDDNVSILSYEVERWDPNLGGKGAAEIWVKIPRIDGNSSLDFITLYYGVNLAACHSTGDVFDSTGFRGVWHLNDQTGVTISDATALGHHGTKLSGQKPNPIDGIIASGQDFSNDNSWIDLGQNRNYLNNVSEVTMQVWIRQPFIDSNVAIMNISGGTPGPKSRFFVELDSGKIRVGGKAVDSSKAGNEIISTPVIQPNNWFHLSVVLNYSQESAAVYVNGLEITLNGNIQFARPVTDNTASLFAVLGSEERGTHRFFNGFMDEFRLFRGERSPEWIRLNYETQRPDSRFYN